MDLYLYSSYMLLWRDRVNSMLLICIENAKNVNANANSAPNLIIQDFKLFSECALFQSVRHFRLCAISACAPFQSVRHFRV